jgi:hypothetical protein
MNANANSREAHSKSFLRWFQLKHMTVLLSGEQESPREALARWRRCNQRMKKMPHVNTVSKNPSVNETAGTSSACLAHRRQ